MSKATIVTLLPYGFPREMTGHNPNWYEFPAAKNNDFECVVIGDSTSWVYILDGKSIQRRHLAYDIAKELIDTYVEAVQYKGEDAFPGLFYVEGEHDKASILKNFAPELEKARRQQNKWFLNLIYQADDVWKKHRLHREISTPMKLAAEAMNQKREWLLDSVLDNSFQECPACGSTIKALISICPICKVQLKENNFTFAGQPKQEAFEEA